MMWCFAKVNNKLAELFFDESKKGAKLILGHCYVEIKKYKTKQEKKWIKDDTKKFIFEYKNGKYFDKNNPKNYLKNIRPTKTKQLRRPTKNEKFLTQEEVFKKLKL